MVHLKATQHQLSLLFFQLRLSYILLLSLFRTTEKKYIQAENIYDLSESPFLSTDDFSSASELEQMVNTILSTENETTRKVFELRLEGYSFYEIGENLGISENSARVVFFRVKTKIKKSLEKEGFCHE